MFYFKSYHVIIYRYCRLIGLHHLSRVFAIVRAIAIRILSVVCYVHPFIFTCESTSCIYVYTRFQFDYGIILTIFPFQSL